MPVVKEYADKYAGTGITVTNYDPLNVMDSHRFTVAMDVLVKGIEEGIRVPPLILAQSAFKKCRDSVLKPLPEADQYRVEYVSAEYPSIRLLTDVYTGPTQMADLMSAAGIFVVSGSATLCRCRRPFHQHGALDAQPACWNVAPDVPLTVETLLPIYVVYNSYKVLLVVDFGATTRRVLMHREHVRLPPMELTIAVAGQGPGSWDSVDARSEESLSPASTETPPPAFTIDISDSEEGEPRPVQRAEGEECTEGRCCYGSDKDKPVHRRSISAGPADSLDRQRAGPSEMPARYSLSAAASSSSESSASGDGFVRERRHAHRRRRQRRPHRPNQHGQVLRQQHADASPYAQFRHTKANE